MRVAVIGAGLAGLTVAHQLSSIGLDVSVFDKSKGTGGRLSSRSHASGWIDHGAPYLSSSSPEFCGFLTYNLPATVLQRWAPESSGVVRTDEQVDFIGVPRNSALTRSLLGEATFHPSTRIARIEASAQGWQIFNDGESLLGVWPCLVIAVPAPQALALLRDQPDFAEPISQVVMEPSWVAALQAGGKVTALADVAVFDHPVVRRIVHNSAKPGRQNENVYLLQANKDWSKAHLEESAASVGPQLMQSFHELSDSASAELLFVHHWRYGFTEKALGQPCLWSAESRLGVCGDWCLGRTVEDAWRSGAELVRRILPIV